MTIKSLINKGDYMINIDLTDAYLTVPIHPNSQQFLRFLWQGQSYQFVTMPFGLNVAPRVFTKLMKPVIAWLRGQGVRMIIFLDDILVLAPTIDTLNQHARMTINLLESLGFLINYKKSTLVPTQRILFLGMLIDSSTMEFVLPTDKSENIQRECRNLLKTQLPSIRQISRVLGLLEFTRPAIWSAPLHYRHIQLLQIESLHQSCDYDTQVNLSREARLDLMWWIRNLPPLRGSPILPPTADLTISSDASKIGWGASWGKIRTGGRWNIQESQDHINILELKAAFFALKAFMKDQNNKVICLKIDNSTAVAYLNNKGGTHSHQLLHLTLEIWKWCETKRLYLLAQHVPGKNNVVADEESRKMKDNNDWKIDSTVIQPLIKECQIDLFASRLTHQLDKYVSWRPDPGAIHVDAFTMNWRNLIAYAFPPFSLIPAVLHKTKKEMATLILIAPLWSAQPWWPLLIDLVIDYPVYLGNNPNLLADVSHLKAIHPLFPALRLAVWKISGDFETEGLSTTAINLLTKSVKTSTTKAYNCSWSQWSRWCEERESDPVLAPVSKVLTFLAEQFAGGKQYRTINVLRSAISSAHVYVDNKPIGQHPLVVRLMRGVSICRPPQPRYQHTWDVALVTGYLSRLGANDTLSEKQLAQKLCMLMALTCPERCSIMASLKVRYLKYFPEGVKFQHTIFRKRLHNGKLGESVYPKFSEKLLCPVACLSTYLDRTKKWREDETDIHQTLFLSFKKPHKPVTSATLSRWLKELIRQSGIKDIFGGHSVRSASTSTAKNAGLSIEMILDMADWTNPSTFNLFYYKPTLPVSYGTSVLSQK